MLKIPESDRMNLYRLVNGYEAELAESFARVLQTNMTPCELLTEPCTKVLQNLNPRGFIEGVQERIYIDGNFAKQTRGQFDAVPFNDFISFETHLDLVDNKGYIWDKRKQVFVKDGRPLSFKGYHGAKRRVLDAFVTKALALFSDWQDVNPLEGSSDDKKLVFCSLKDYLTPTTRELPKFECVSTEHLLKLLDTGEITLRQYGFISLHPNHLGFRNYALEVTRVANSLYEIVKNMDDPVSIEEVLTDAVELTNNEFGRDSLSKPKERYHPVALTILEKLHEVKDSPKGLSIAFQVFVNSVYERKQLRCTKDHKFKRWMGIHAIL